MDKCVVRDARVLRKHLKAIAHLQVRSGKKYKKEGICHFSNLIFLSFYRLIKTILLHFSSVHELRLKAHVKASPLLVHYQVRQEREGCERRQVCGRTAV